MKEVLPGRPPPCGKGEGVLQSRPTSRGKEDVEGEIDAGIGTASDERKGGKK